jgi:hypothetical protein
MKNNALNNMKKGMNNITEISNKNSVNNLSPKMNSVNNLSPKMNSVNNLSPKMNIRTRLSSINTSKYLHYGIFILVIFVIIFVIVHFDPFGWFHKHIPRESSIGPKKEVFHIEASTNNQEQKYHFTYDEAKLVCKIYDSELATMEQMYTSVKDGANWDSYGWIQDQMSIKPVKNSCGNDGILEGGYYENKNEPFGVNCYGMKQTKLDFKPVQDECNVITEEDQAINKIRQIQKEIKSYNNNKWSRYN